MKRMMWKVMLVATLAAGVLLAQGDKPTAPAAEFESFRLDFVVKEIQDGKAVNSRNYSMLATATDAPRNRGGHMRASNKFQVPKDPPSLYSVERGMNIDCTSILRLQNRLSMDITAQISTLVPTPDKSTPPLTRSIILGAFVVVPIGKPTTLFSSDDLASTRTLQLELTATPVK